MSLKVLQHIEQAEIKAEEVRAQAQRQARELLKDAEEACVTNERNAAKEQRVMAQRVLEDARLTASKRIDALAQDEAKQREVIVAAARKKLDAAADLIFERTVQDGNR